jgi:threonylcarbamoyladenosine tRNA methylthiotransferase MtaB
VFGADLIAGFPTETDAMAQASVDLVDDAGLTFLHVFPYSQRPGTPAARMPQVNGAVIRTRAARLREKGHDALKAWLGGQTGKTVDILMENEQSGRSAHYAPVVLAKPNIPGAIIRARITGATAESLTGEAVS